MHNEVIIAKGSKIYGLYILESSNVVVHSLSASENFHDKNIVWDLSSRHDDCSEAVSEHVNKFCRRQGMKTHETAELSLIFWGKVVPMQLTWLVESLVKGRRVKNKG